jgi:Kef-type K+ transport system membrane component KefB
MLDNNFDAHILLTFGGLFLLGLIADFIGRHTPFPRVTLLLLTGIIIGPSVFDWLPSFTDQWFPILTNIALTMIGFLLGQKITRNNLANLGRSVVIISVVVVIVTASVVFTGLSLCSVPVGVALLLATVATATAPAATLDVVHEYQARGQFTDSLLGIVAIDDAWALLLFSFVIAIIQSLSGEGDVFGILSSGMWDIGGGALLGLLLGVPMAFLTGRIKPGEATQAEVLGMVMVCAGTAVWFEVSYLTSAMVLGTVVANFAKHCERPFQAVEKMEWPFLILFFLLAGASLQISALLHVGWIGFGYIVLRIFGRILGGFVGGRLASVSDMMTNWIGVALLPQAGVAIGMALVASQRFPELRDTILPIVLGATVFFEITGPILTRYVLQKVGEIAP